MDRDFEACTAALLAAIQCAAECGSEAGLTEGERRLLHSLAVELRQGPERPLSVALCALFQNGKSTTVNTLLEGRELTLSGIDGGLRTSAGRIEFTFGTTEAVEVRWLSPEQIALQLAARTGLPWAAGDLSAPGDVAWSRLAGAWNAQLRAGDQGALRRLGEAAILLAHCASPELDALKRRSWAAHEISRRMTAPSDDSQRWLRALRGGRVDGASLRARILECFPLDCAAYMFIERACVRLSAQILDQMNLRLIDIPGLGVSERDDRLARETVAEAQLALYIFDGEREPGELEREFVRTLRKRAGRTRVLFALNRRGRPRAAVERSVRELLRTHGWGDAPLVCYHARLANLAAQGRLMLRDRLDDATRDALLARARSLNPSLRAPEDAWRETAADALAPLDAAAAHRVLELGPCAEAVELVERHSGWGGLLAALGEASACDDRRERLRLFALGGALDELDRAITELERLRAEALRGEEALFERRAAELRVQADRQLQQGLAQLRNCDGLRAQLERDLGSDMARGYSERSREGTIRFFQQRLREIGAGNPWMRELGIMGVRTAISWHHFPNAHYADVSLASTIAPVPPLLQLPLYAALKAVERASQKKLTVQRVFQREASLSATATYVRGTIVPQVLDTYQELSQKALQAREEQLRAESFAHSAALDRCLRALAGARDALAGVEQEDGQEEESNPNQ